MYIDTYIYKHIFIYINICRDEIDSSHYPVFHQMEGVRIFDNSELPVGATKEEAKIAIAEDLKDVLTGLAKHLFGEVEIRYLCMCIYCMFLYVYIHIFVSICVYIRILPAYI
jgi:hypothetical protein